MKLNLNLKLNSSAVTVCNICIRKAHAIHCTALRCTESSIRLEMSFRIECESMATNIKINVTITIIIVGFIIANDIPAFSALIHIIRSNSMRFVSIRSNPIQSNPYTHRVSGNEATCHNKKYFNPTTTPHPLYLTILPWQIRKT